MVVGGFDAGISVLLDTLPIRILKSFRFWTSSIIGANLLVKK